MRKYIIGIALLCVAAVGITQATQYWRVVSENTHFTKDVFVSETLGVTGATTLTGAVAASSTLAVTGATTLTGAATLSSTLDVAGAITYEMQVIDYTSTETARTLTVAESGTTFCITAADAAAEVEFVLPTAAAGLTYTFVDGDETSGADLVIQAGADDTINGGTASKEYVCSGDAVKQTCTIVAINAVRWIVVAENGTWTNDNG